MAAHTGPDRHREHPARRNPEPVSTRNTETTENDYWEEVALARLRLAQLALVITLAGSVVIALILG